MVENIKKNESVDLGDGRRVQVIAYQDDSIRFYIHGVQGVGARKSVVGAELQVRRGVTWPR
jgi:hypothetical protein